MAKDLLDGAGWRSIFNNPYLPGEGGSVVVAYLAALFFFILGDSLFSLVLVSIFFAVLIFTVFFLLLERYFNRYVAIIFSVLYILSPANYYRFSMFTIGSHAESVLFSVLGLLCFFGIFLNKDNYDNYQSKFILKKIAALFTFFGFICGFGIYFDYQCLLMVLTLMFFWFLLDKKIFFKAYFYIFLAGLIIGLLPWIIYNITHNFNGIKLHNLNIIQILLSNSFSRAAHMFGKIIIALAGKTNLGLLLYFIVISAFITLILSKRSYYFQICKKLIFHGVKFTLPVDHLKSLIIVVYITMFICTWSMLYLPLGGNFVSILNSKEVGAEYLLLGLEGRFFHLFPFLFALTAIGIVNLFPGRKEGLYTIKFLVVSAFSILILIAGSINYYNLLVVPHHAENRINSLAVKGFSARLAYMHNKKEISNFLDNDMVNLSSAAQLDEKLWTIFTSRLSRLYNTTTTIKMLNEISNDPQMEEAKKPLYYLLVGLNIGDYLEGYDISAVNKLADTLVPKKSKYFFYE
ncbi:MAG: glycosyltransferase family 39 protein, partial [Candidatus Omnitrophica bacterium]|nr:glycosyltransferase family 39 protein [Candidatus Omnitrophota bacterium]